MKQGFLLWRKEREGRDGGGRKRHKGGERRGGRERERRQTKGERLEYFRIIIFILVAEGMEYLKTCEGNAIQSHSSYSSQHT